MNIPSFDQLLQPTLTALHTLGGTARIEDLNRTVIEQIQLPADIAEMQHVTKQGATNERGAAPITLIDGEKLLDLLTEYQIGLTKKPIEYYEFDPEKLSQVQ